MITFVVAMLFYIFLAKKLAKFNDKLLEHHKKNEIKYLICDEPLCL